MDARSHRQLRRADWFRRGAAAASRVVLAAPPNAYLCPLCLNYYTYEQLTTGVVTDEHVPPKAVGGKSLVLTCQSCNGLASGMLDEFVADDEKQRTFGTPHSRGALPGSVSVAGVRNAGSIAYDGETFVIFGDPGQNNPETVAAHTELLDRMGPGSSLTLTFRMRRKPRRTRIGWMRSAYLAAFAVYGYRYVLQPAFDPLRAAFRDPDGAPFEPVILQGQDVGALDPFIALMVEPAWLHRSPVVFLGPRVILLPPPSAPTDWFAALSERLITAFPLEARFGSVLNSDFPLEPLHLDDA